MTHNSPVNFKLMHFLLWIKGSHQSPNFETFECSGENLPNFSCYFPNSKPQVSFSSSFASLSNFMTTFLAQTLYTLVKGSPLKCKVLRFLSARVKIRQIPYINFEKTSQFLFRFFIILQCHYT